MAKQRKIEEAYRTLSFGEEVFNSITHGIGTLLSIAALVLLVVFANIRGNAWHIVSFSIFGSSMVLLYLSSTLYHSFTREDIKNLFARFDHAAIFLLIAGTYTPFVLTAIRLAMEHIQQGKDFLLFRLLAVYLIKFQEPKAFLNLLNSFLYSVAESVLLLLL